MKRVRNTKLTLKTLALEVQRLREAMEDYEDLPDVLAVLEKPGTPIPMAEIRKKVWAVIFRILCAVRRRNGVAPARAFPNGVWERGGKSAYE